MWGGAELSWVVGRLRQCSLCGMEPGKGGTLGHQTSVLRPTRFYLETGLQPIGGWTLPVQAAPPAPARLMTEAKGGT